tara:strand:- start:7394 stop:7933 length:540 start_codon:yes stop_codon:yes gene_type:complete
MKPQRNEPWTDPDSPWKTEAAYRAWLRGGIRRVWSKYPLKIIFIKNNRFKAPLGQHDKMVWCGICNLCTTTLRTSKLQVDHLHPMPPMVDGLDDYMNTMFPTQAGMQFACKPCHDATTLAERKGISLGAAKIEKAAIQVMKRPVEGQKQWLLANGYTEKTLPSNAKKRREAITSAMTIK